MGIQNGPSRTHRGYVALFYWMASEDAIGDLHHPEAKAPT